MLKMVVFYLLINKCEEQYNNNMLKTITNKAILYVQEAPIGLSQKNVNNYKKKCSNKKISYAKINNKYINSVVKYFYKIFCLNDSCPKKKKGLVRIENNSTV